MTFPQDIMINDILYKKTYQCDYYALYSNHLHQFIITYHVLLLDVLDNLSFSTTDLFGYKIYRVNGIFTNLEPYLKVVNHFNESEIAYIIRYLF